MANDVEISFVDECDLKDPSHPKCTAPSDGENPPFSMPSKLPKHCMVNRNLTASSQVV